MARRAAQQTSTDAAVWSSRLRRILASMLLVLVGAGAPLVVASPASATTAITITDPASCAGAGGTVISGACRFYTELNVPAGTTLTSTMQIQLCRNATIDGTMTLADGVGLLVACETLTNNGTINMSNASITVLDSQASFVNNGTINQCGVTVSGTISGNPLTNTCPAITDPASCAAVGGTVVSGACRFYTELSVPAGTTLTSTMQIQLCRNATIDGTMTLADGVGLLVACETLTNNGTINMSNASITVLDSQAWFVNNGTVNQCGVTVSGTISGNPLTDACPDAAAPTTTITVPAPDGSNGWFVSAPTVSISADDGGGSGVAETRCVLDPADAPASYADLPSTTCPYLGAGASVTGQGEHVVYAASIDNDGNDETPVSESFKIDSVLPALSPSLSPTPVYLNASVTASPNATDGGSGIDSSSCDPVDTSAVGAQAVDCAATDLAGNANTSTLHYTVWYALAGFASPASGSKWKAGQTVPVKLVLGDANGVRVSDATAAALAASCRVTFAATGVQPLAASCMKYDALSHQFLFNWKLGKSPLGADTITARVSYGAGTTPNTLSEGISIVK